MIDKNEIERLEAIITELRAECAKLRTALANAEQEREWYRKAISQYEREKGEFKDVDFNELVKMSAGPVETIV